jgi:hypothetical protein
LAGAASQAATGLARIATRRASVVVVDGALTFRAVLGSRSTPHQPADAHTRRHQQRPTGQEEKQQSRDATRHSAGTPGHPNTQALYTFALGDVNMMHRSGLASFLGDRIVAGTRRVPDSAHGVCGLHCQEILPHPTDQPFPIRPTPARSKSMMPSTGRCPQGYSGGR